MSEKTEKTASMLTGSIAIREFSRRGDPLVFENGGASSSMGGAEIWCGADGRKLRPLYVLSHGHLSNGQHCAFLVKPGMVQVSADWHRGPCRMNIRKITRVTRESDSQGEVARAYWEDACEMFVHDPRHSEMADAAVSAQLLPAGFRIGDQVEAEIISIDDFGLNVTFAGVHGRLDLETDMPPKPTKEEILKSWDYLCINAYGFSVGDKIYPRIKRAYRLAGLTVELTLNDELGEVPGICGTELERTFALAIEAAYKKANDYHCRSVYFADIQPRR